MNVPKVRVEVRLLLATLDDETQGTGEALLAIRAIAHRIRSLLDERSETERLRELLWNSL